MDDFGPAYGGGDYPSTGFDYGSAYGALGTGASSVHGLHAPGVDFFNELQGGELHEDHGDLHRAADAADAGLQQAELTGFPGLLPGMAPRRRSRAAPSTGAMFVRAVTSNAARSSANIEDAQAQVRETPSSLRNKILHFLPVTIGEMRYCVI